MSKQESLKRVKYLWQDELAAKLEGADRLVYRSNKLGGGLTTKCHAISLIAATSCHACALPSMWNQEFSGTRTLAPILLCDWR